MRKSSILFFAVAASFATASACFAIGNAPVAAVAEDSTSQPTEAPAYKYEVKDAYIGYRNSDTESYGKGGSEIGSYFLSKDGWNEDAEDIVMTIKGNVTTKLESKIVYIYEYRPTLVKWAGADVPQNEDKTYSLKKPEAEGAYDLEIYFTKTLVTNPVDLTNLNWASFFTVNNMMCIGSWAVIVIGIITVYFVSRRYKYKGATDVQAIKNELVAKIDSAYGEETSKAFSKLLDDVVGKVFVEINGRLAKVDNNSAIMLRCLLLMQENTPEARLAITELLTKLQTEADGKAEEVKALIESEMAKYKAESEAKKQAIEDAKELNQKWADTAKELEEPSEPAEEEPKGDGYGKL